MAFGAWVVLKAAPPHSFLWNFLLPIFHNHVANVSHHGGCITSSLVGRKNKHWLTTLRIFCDFENLLLRTSVVLWKKICGEKYRPSVINVFNKWLFSNVCHKNWAGEGWEYRWHENRVVTRELTGALTPTTRVPPRAGVGAPLHHTGGWVSRQREALCKWVSWITLKIQGQQASLETAPLSYFPFFRVWDLDGKELVEAGNKVTRDVTF